MGYFDSGATVPEYRTVAGRWCDDYGRVFHLSDPGLGFVQIVPLGYGAAELEGYATATELLSMRHTQGAEIIRKNLQVDVTTFQFSPQSVQQVVMNIKLRLLDGLAERRDRIDGMGSYEPLPRSAEIIELKPGFAGMTVDLRALWRKLRGTRRD